MPFGSGENWKGNKSGRPRGSGRVQDIFTAMAQVEKKEKKKFWVYAFERAYKDDAVLATMIRKLLPENINLAGHDGSALTIKIVSFDDKNGNNAAV